MPGVKKNPIFTGKVRDIYEDNAHLIIRATDRMSAFDRVLCEIPYKGAVLNQLSAWWFEQTNHIIDNHFVQLLDSNSMRVKKCEVIPIEVIVRGFLTGSTNTSIWTLYNQGERQFFETILPENLKKNTALPTPIITPTNKSNEHDQPLKYTDIPDIIDLQLWHQIKNAALVLFQFGQQVSQKNGFILVDTKYEFGLDVENRLCLIDECHTPDSSRYWDAATYQENIKQGLEPMQYDKECLRLWYREQCDPYTVKNLPTAPAELITLVSQRYQEIYERLTQQKLRIH